MLSLSLDTAKNLGIALAIGLIALSVLAAVVLRSIAQKFAVAVILALLAALVWTQRTSLDECAGRVRDSVTVGLDTTNVTCSFFGQEITVEAVPDT